MTNYEHPHTQPEYASPDDLQHVFDTYASVLPATTRIHDPELDKEVIAQSSPIELDPQSNLLDTIRFATDTPFQTIDSIVASHLPADFDPNERNGGMTYPEIIALTLHGFYGDIVPAERSISYVIAKDPDTAQLTGFALQHFHDADSYMFAKPDEDPRWSVYVQPTELLRTVAANLDAYRSFISDTIATTSATDSDTKRVAELRQLDTNDLVLFDTALHEHIVPDPTLSTE